MPSDGHAHASLGRRAKEEATLSGRPEDTLCIILVVVACDRIRVFLHCNELQVVVAGCSALQAVREGKASGGVLRGIL